jgi:hypothetical protein
MSSKANINGVTKAILIVAGMIEAGQPALSPMCDELRAALGITKDAPPAADSPTAAGLGKEPAA